MTFALNIRTAKELAAEQAEQTKAIFERAVKDHLDAVAKEKKYDSAISILGYVSSPRLDWRAEAEAFSIWQTAVWTFVIERLEAVQAGLEAPPENPSALIRMLPKINWRAGAVQSKGADPG